MIRSAMSSSISKICVECKPEELDKLIEEYKEAGWKIQRIYNEPTHIDGRGNVVGFVAINH